jgi:hypothetical protein
MCPEVIVAPADGHERDLLVSVASDLPRLQEAMGNPPADISSGVLNGYVFVGASKEEIGMWRMLSDGRITHRTVNEPIDQTVSTSSPLRWTRPRSPDCRTWSRPRHVMRAS